MLPSIDTFIILQPKNVNYSFSVVVKVNISDPLKDSKNLNYFTKGNNNNFHKREECEKLCLNGKFKTFGKKILILK